MAKNLVVFFSAAAAALIAVILLPVFNPAWSPLRWSSRVYADLVVMNATIYTSDPSTPFADAMAVRNGRILAVGSYPLVQEFLGHMTRKINLQRKVVVPGFIDSHVHLIFGGLQDLREKRGPTLSQWIFLGGVKAFADGSLGSNSALFHEPYEDDPDSHGLKVADFEWLLNATLASDKSGLQVAIHAIGDKANDLVLDMFTTVASSNGVKDRRFRIEHAQHLTPGSTMRFGRQRIIASVQPDHLLDDADSAEKKLGHVRAHQGSYLFGSLLASNAQLAFGSDWPVADINPLRSIQTAIARVPPGWETAWIPSERVSLNDALNAYTISAANAGFLDHELGSLSRGKYADFVVLDAAAWNEFAGQDVSSRVVEATYVNGVQAYP